MKTLENTTPKFATHPGEILLDEINANDYSQSEFAKLIGFERSQLNEIIKGKRNINANLALLLEKALGIDADYWMEAQKNFDLDKARIEAKNQERIEAIEQWNSINDIIAVKFLKKENIICGDPVKDLATIKNVYNVTRSEQLAVLSVQPSYARFRKSTKLKNDPINIIGWVKLVHYKASQVEVSKFDESKKIELISNLRNILAINKNTQEKVKNLLAVYGIKLIYQEKGESTPIDGVSFWSGNNPAIGMTLRHKRLDNFSFTLFHELGHIFNHLVKDKNAEFIDLKTINEDKEYKNSKEEVEANIFAMDFLIDKDAWNSFFTKQLNYTDDMIIAFAKKCDCHPCIVRGRINHENNNYRIKTKIDYSIY